MSESGKVTIVKENSSPKKADAEGGKYSTTEAVRYVARDPLSKVDLNKSEENVEAQKDSNQDTGGIKNGHDLQEMDNNCGKISHGVNGDSGKISHDVNGDSGKVGHDINGDSGKVGHDVNGDSGKVGHDVNGDSGNVGHDVNGDSGKVGHDVNGDSGKVGHDVIGKVTLEKTKATDGAIHSTDEQIVEDKADVVVSDDKIMNCVVDSTPDLPLDPSRESAAVEKKLVTNGDAALVANGDVEEYMVMHPKQTNTGGQNVQDDEDEYVVMSRPAHNGAQVSMVNGHVEGVSGVDSKERDVVAIDTGTQEVNEDSTKDKAEEKDLAMVNGQNDISKDNVTVNNGMDAKDAVNEEGNKNGVDKLADVVEQHTEKSTEKITPKDIEKNAVSKDNISQ